MPSTSALPRPFRLMSVVAIAMFAFVISHSAAVGQSLVYVDADDLFNLEPSAGGSLDDAMERLTGAANNADNKWRARVFAPDNAFGATGTVYESDAPEDSPEIKQTITGLSSGTSYDMYAVWWSATNDNWVLRAGLTSNPGGNTVYDRTGAAGTAGQLAVFADWTTPPDDNPNIADGFTGIEAATLEGNRVMLLAKIGTAVANGSGESAVFFDDTVNLAGAGRAWFDGVAYAPMGANVGGDVTATIDRTTGALSINSGADFLINRIEIGSAAGALDPVAWSPVTGILDNGGGFDDEAWQITSTTANSLAEEEIDGGGGTDGAAVGPAGLATLSLGNVWLKSPFEDVTLNLRLNGSQFTVPITVQYTGGTPINFGDFDIDGDIDVDDYRVVLRGLNQTQAGLTDLQSYALGDVTGDQQTNFADLVRFRQIYDDNNGAGAFALLIGGHVPEPTSVLLLALGAVLLGWRRRVDVAKFGTAAALLVGVFVACPDADAQITYIDAIATAGMSTAANGNPPINTMISPNSSPGSMIAAAGAEDVLLWRVRGLQGASAADGGTDTNNFANNGNAIQNGLNTTDNPGVLDLELVTTATGLDPAKVYNIYAFTWDDTGGGFWDMAARVGPSGNFTEFNQSTPGAFKVDAAFQAGPNAVSGINVLGQGADDFTDYIDGNREMFGMQVGLVSGVSTTDVYIRPSALSAGERTWYDGIGFAEVQDIPTLEVNTTTGEVFLKNEYNNPVNLSYYEIRSASGSLNPSGWNSLDDQNFDAVDGDDPGTDAGDSLLEGWDEAGPVGLDGDHDMSGTVDAADYVFWRKNDGTQPGYDAWRANFGATGGAGGGSSTVLNETNFLRNSTLAANSSISLGNAFKIGGTQDLTLSFGDVGNGSLGLSAVRYVNSEASSVASVPEPAAFVLLATIGICGAVYRRRAPG